MAKSWRKRNSRAEEHDLHTMLSLCGQDVHLKPIGIRWKMVKYLLGSPSFDIYMVWGSIAQHASSLILLRLATCEGLLN